VTTECPREDQVVSAVLTGAWPDRCDEELRRHAEGCAVCGEVASVSRLLRQDHDRARHDVRIPSAGQVWWRSAVRARLDAAHAATQPMTWLHGITAAVALGFALAVIGYTWRSLAAGAGWVTDVALRFAPANDVTALIAETLQQRLPLILVVAACVVLAPVALYFALSDD
jgi:hypothetical protein